MQRGVHGVRKADQRHGCWPGFCGLARNAPRNHFRRLNIHPGRRSTVDISTLSIRPVVTALSSPEPDPTSMDVIFIEGFAGDTVIGIHETELHDAQPLV